MKLRPCPDSPNCVSSLSESASHRIAPIAYNTSAEEALEKIKSVLLSFPRTRLLSEADRYLHVEFKTAFFKFTDDVEIVLDDEEKLIHLRSASRAGYWDFGVNRSRVEAIRTKF
ncbi:MAG: DUF1499 domain-containing protein, partial [Gammaproteobacteria bacterium]